MTSSMLARNGFTSLKKRLHPMIKTRESKKRRYEVLQQLSNPKLNSSISSCNSPKNIEKKNTLSGLGLKSPMSSTDLYSYNNVQIIDKNKAMKKKVGIKRKKKNPPGEGKI